MRSGSPLRPQTADGRFLLADALTADSWRIAEAARRGLGPERLPPAWARGRERDARDHRELQHRLKGLLGRPMTERPLEDALQRALALMRRAAVRGAFGGGLAVIIWGQPRVTQDLDLVLEIEEPQVDALLQAAREEGYTLEEDSAAGARDLLVGGFLRLLPPAGAAPVALDLLRAQTTLEREALGRARVFEVAGLSVPVLAPEDLVLLKLVAFRPKDTFDLETVIDATREVLDLAYLRRWADRLNLRERLEAFLATGD